MTELIHIVCSNCHSRYAMTRIDAGALPMSVMVCEKCRRNIKIIICPHCDAFYTLTYQLVPHDRYMMACKKCAASFTVAFPAAQEPVQKSENKIIHDTGGDDMMRRIDNGARNAVKMEPVHNPGNSGTGDDAADGTVPRGSPGNDGVFGELFSIMGKTFTPVKIVLTFPAVIIAFLLLAYLRSRAPVFAKQEALNFFLNIPAAASILVVYVITATAIARVTVEDILHGRKWGIRKAAMFALGKAGPVSMVNLLLCGLLFGVFAVFGIIPVVGPFLFALFFFPLYALSIFIIMMMMAGFWFYPPFLACSHEDVENHSRTFLHFIRSHVFTLLYLVPIMIIVSALIFTLVVLLHYGAWSVMAALVRLAPGSETVKTLNAVPPVFSIVTNLSLLGRNMDMVGAVLNELFVYHKIAGIIMGLIFTGITLLFFSVMISFTATLSAAVYVLLCRGQKESNTGIMRVMLFMLAVLGILYFFKKLYL